MYALLEIPTLRLLLSAFKYIKGAKINKLFSFIPEDEIFYHNRDILIEVGVHCTYTNFFCMKSDTCCFSEVSGFTFKTLAQIRKPWLISSKHPAFFTNRSYQTEIYAANESLLKMFQSPINS